ncbi:MAG: hypothetical protein ABFD96_10680 [Armatimonadia bacterium]
MQTYSNPAFKPDTSEQANRDAAERWLGKAISMEAEAKPKGIIDKALERACDYERAANNFKKFGNAD